MKENLYKLQNGKEFKSKNITGRGWCVLVGLKVFLASDETRCRRSMTSWHSTAAQLGVCTATMY